MISKRIFTQALAMAFKHPKKDVFLIVEEMSRGNMQVFWRFVPATR